MPIRERQPRRKGTKPVVFFSGTMTEAKRTPLKDIQTTLEKTGVEFISPRHAKRITSKFRGEVTRRMRAMKAQGHKAKTISFELPQGVIELRLRRSGNSFTLHQQPMVHGVGYSRALLIDAYRDLQSILSDRLRLIYKGPNVISKDSTLYRRGTTHYAQFRPPFNDSYAVHIAAPMRQHQGTYGTVEEAPSEQISKVVITISPKLSDKRGKERKEFYKKELEMYGIPIKFV